MFCQKCGFKFSGETESKEDVVGNEFRSTEEDIDTDISNEESYKFYDSKNLGMLTIKSTTSVVTINKNTLALNRQNSRCIFFKGTPINTEVKINEIKQIRRKKALDISDFIFGILFFLGGFAYAPNWILSLMFFWSSISKRLMLITSRGAIKIPIKGSKKEMERMLNQLEQINPRIIKNY